MSILINEHWDDTQGRPSGGCTQGHGFTISWQNGPLGAEPNRKEPNGAFVTDVITAAIRRLEYYQQGMFPHEANQQAIDHLAKALYCLELRTQERKRRGVEGTHQA